MREGEIYSPVPAFGPKTQGVRTLLVVNPFKGPFLNGWQFLFSRNVCLAPAFGDISHVQRNRKKGWLR